MPQRNRVLQAVPARDTPLQVGTRLDPAQRDAWEFLTARATVTGSDQLPTLAATAALASSIGPLGAWPPCRRRSGGRSCVCPHCAACDLVEELEAEGLLVIDDVVITICTPAGAPVLVPPATLTEESP